MMPDPPALLLQEANFLLATHGPVAIIVVDGLTTIEQAGAMGDLVRATVQRHPGCCALLFIVRDGAAIPNAEVRQRFQRTVRSAQGKLKLLAAVIEGTGFAAASKRSIFTMVVSSLMGPVAVKVFPDPPKACVWLATEGRGGGVAVSATELSAYVATLPSTAAAR